MTTTTTGAPSPKVRNSILAVAALGLAAIMIVSQPFTSSKVSSEQVADSVTPTLPESVTGFEYNNEATPGHVASAGVTGQYYGYNPDFEEGSTRAVPDQGTIDLTTPAITQEFIDGNAAPSSAADEPRVNPKLAVSVGLDPGAIDELVRGGEAAPAKHVPMANNQLR